MLLGLLVMTGSSGGAQTRADGFDIADDASLFSDRFRVEFEDMNATFGDFGFELEIRDGEQPRMSEVRARYGPADETDDVEVILFLDDREVRATLRFHYYGEVGFGVRPDDPDGPIVRVKRREN